MSEDIERAKEHAKEVRLLEDYLNSSDGDNKIVSDLDFYKTRTKDGKSEIVFWYYTKQSMSEDEFNELIKKMEN